MIENGRINYTTCIHQVEGHQSVTGFQYRLNRTNIDRDIKVLLLTPIYVKCLTNFPNPFMFFHFFSKKRRFLAVTFKSFFWSFFYFFFPPFFQPFFRSFFSCFFPFFCSIFAWADLRQSKKVVFLFLLFVPALFFLV